MGVAPPALAGEPTRFRIVAVRRAVRSRGFPCGLLTCPRSRRDLCESVLLVPPRQVAFEDRGGQRLHAVGRLGRTV
jgi:hypothetical protein